MVDTSTCATSLRRFTGPEADELAILCRPNARSPDTLHQGEAAYRALFRDLTAETLFLRDIRRELPVLRAICRERGVDGFPCALVEAPLCRPELPCEAEALAMLPRAIAGAE